MALNLLTFETEHLTECLEYVNGNILAAASPDMPVRGVWTTGVGCIMHRQLITASLNVRYVTPPLSLPHPPLEAVACDTPSSGRSENHV